jgi:hypothetical protein
MATANGVTPANDSLPDASSTHCTLPRSSWPAAHMSNLQQQQQCVKHTIKSAQVSEAAPVVAYPAIERALQRRTAVVALQQRAADASAHSRDRNNNSTCLSTTNSSNPSSQGQHAHADTWQGTGVSARTTGCCMQQQGLGAEDQPQQLRAILQVQAGPEQARRTTSSQQAVDSTAELRQDHCYVAAAHTAAVPDTAVRTTQATSSAALAAELQLVRSWRQQRHAAACTIQAAVRSWLRRRQAQHYSKARQLQLCKARHILTVWKSQVMHRRAVEASIVQQLEAGGSRGCQLWQKLQHEWAGEGRHVCAAVYHRRRVQAAVLRAWAGVMACGSSRAGGLQMELDANS